MITTETAFIDVQPMDFQLGAKKLDNSDVETRNAGIKDASKKFEALFLSMMIKEMRKTVPDSGLMGSGPSKDIYNDMLDNAYADKMASRGGLGLSEALYRQMKFDQ